MNQSEKTKVAVSVIIPTLNGAKQLQELLTLLSYQTIELKDVHVVDSSSSDDTVKVAESFGVDVTVIDRQDFDHGGTRSRLAEKVEGEIVLFFTQDAVPATKDCVEKLLNRFTTDPQIAVCYGRQLASFDADENAKRLREFNYPDISVIRSFDDKETLGLKTVFTSNTFAAYRKDKLAEIDYFKDGLIFGEDMEAVGRLVKNGYKVAYVSEAQVYHSHNYSIEEDFKRSFDIGVLHTSENWLIKTYGKAEGIGKKFVLGQLGRHLKKLELTMFFDTFLRSCSKYAGYVLGRNYESLPKKLVLSCSMHSAWWTK